ELIDFPLPNSDCRERHDRPCPVQHRPRAPRQSAASALITAASAIDIAVSAIVCRTSHSRWPEIAALTPNCRKISYIAIVAILVAFLPNSAILRAEKDVAGRAKAERRMCYR